MADPHPDSIPDHDDDTRSDIEQAVESRKDEAEGAGGGATSSPLEPTGTYDGNAGTGGVTKNQDEAAQ